nr:AMP-binding protein [Thalassobacillus sp. CUG 92003]
MQARKFPEKDGIITSEERMSYREWDDRVNRFAHQLLAQGITAGDKVMVHLPNTPEFLISYFAIQRIEAVAVPINAKLVTREIEYILSHSDAKAFITHDLLFAQVTALPDNRDLVFIKTGEASGPWLSFDALLERGDPSDIQSTLSDDDEAAHLYTSGTTGNPKGVVFTNRNILTVATMMAIEMKMDPSSRILHLMPLSHSAPLHLFLVAGTYVGAAHITAPTFTPDLLLGLVSKEKATHFFGAPVAYLLTAKQPEIDRYDLSSMTHWVYGGAPLSCPEVEFVQKQFNTEHLHCVYGLTEAGPNGSLLAPEDHSHKAGSIGKRGALNCEIKIVDDHGQDVPRGEVGEIVLRGEGNMKGYYKDAEKTAEALQNGWLYTGDMAKQDEDGFFWVVDRKKDMIISGGVNIYPKEIENALLAHPRVADAAVVGVPHPDWGETVKAFIVTDGAFDDMESTCPEFLQGKIADYKIPRLYESLAELPRNATGKLLKNQLREQMNQS